MCLPVLLLNTAERCNTVQVIHLRYSPPAVTQSSTCSESTAHAEPLVQRRNKQAIRTRGAWCSGQESGMEKACVWYQGAAAMHGCSCLTNLHPHPQTAAQTNPLSHQEVKRGPCCRLNAATTHTSKASRLFMSQAHTHTLFTYTAACAVPSLLYCVWSCGKTREGGSIKEGSKNWYDCILIVKSIRKCQRTIWNQKESYDYTIFSYFTSLFIVGKLFSL